MLSLEKDHIYTPHQPHLENQANYTNYIIDKKHKLYGKVHEIYQYDASYTGKEVIALPDGCSEIMFSFHPTHIETYLVTSPLTLQQFNYQDTHHVFSIRFITGWHGYGVNALSFERGHDIYDAHGLPVVNCLATIPNFEKLYSAVVSTASFERRVEACIDFFEKLYKPINLQEEIVRYSCTYLGEKFGRATLKDLEQHLGYSSRYIRKIFEQYIGYSPKTLNEIIKFQYSFNSLVQSPNRSLSDIACDSGYYDLSHMNKSYLKIVNELPKNLYKKVYG